MGLLRESCAKVVGDGLSYDFKLECQLGIEKVRVDVQPGNGIQDP